MAFVTKEWKDRLVEFAGRRKLKNVTTGAETVFDVSRSEGAVSQAGDAFSAANMNNLEQRIKNEFDTVNGSLQQCFQSASNGKALVAAAISGKGISTAANATYQQMANNINSISKGAVIYVSGYLVNNNGSWATELCFNISSYSGYRNISVNNIFIECEINLRPTVKTMEKYYNQSSGIITCKWLENGQYWNIASNQPNLNAKIAIIG